MFEYTPLGLGAAGYAYLFGFNAGVQTPAYFGASLGTLYAEDGTGTKTLTTGVAGVAGTSIKMAIAYDGTNIRCSVKGQPVVITAWDGDWNLAATLAIGSAANGTAVTNGQFKNVKIFNTALTDAQLIAMTT